MKLTSLPFDVLHGVAAHLDSRSDILHFALSSRHLFSALCPALYSDVELTNIEQCHSTLEMLNRRPDIARHVQKLLVCFPSGPKGRSTNYNCMVSNLVHSLAHTLDALQTFIWDADEIPMRDDMWLALRTSCPRLATVGVSYGEELPESHSNLFQFNGLRGFIFNAKQGFYERSIEDGLQEFQAVPQLWDMLIRRSPELEELHVNGAPFIFAQTVHPLFHAHWPKLLSLSLGDIVLDWDPRTGIRPPFITFLEAHPQLRSLRTSRAALNPALLTSLAPGSLPELTYFGGAIEHLKALAPIHHQITSVALDEPVVIHDLTPSLLFSVLRGLKSLTELRVRFDFQSTYESGGLIRSIAQACPGLIKLEIICTRQSLLTIDTFATAVRNAPRLRYLRMILVCSRQENPLPVCATTIAHILPRLHAFSITFVLPDAPLLLCFRSEIGHVNGEPRHPYTDTGYYVVETDEHGLPTSVTCTEHRSSRSLLSRLRSFFVPWTTPLSLRKASSQVRKKCYSVDLRPCRKKRRGLGLVLEKSAAGDEIRAFIAVMSLSSIAVWRFFS